MYVLLSILLTLLALRMGTRWFFMRLGEAIAKEVIFPQPRCYYVAPPRGPKHESDGGYTLDTFAP